MPRFSQLALLAVVASTAVVSDAFTVVPRATSTPSLSRQLPSLRLSDESKDADSAVFIPPPGTGDDDEADLDTVEGLGRGAAKVRTVQLY
jgi:hypothetical protein